MNLYLNLSYLYIFPQSTHFTSPMHSLSVVGILTLCMTTGDHEALILVLLLKATKSLPGPL